MKKLHPPTTEYVFKSRKRTLADFTNDKVYQTLIAVFIGAGAVFLIFR